MSQAGSVNTHHQAGMTLIEVLVVLLITSIVASSISYVAFKQTPSIKDLSTRIAQNIRMTRQKAIRTGRMQQFVIDLASNRFEFPETSITLPEEFSITLRTAENQLIDDESAGISFFADASSTGGQILLESAKQSIKILVVWISGKVMVNAAVLKE